MRDERVAGPAGRAGREHAGEGLHRLGRKGRVCFPSQATKATALFPDAQWHWFDNCGHFPHWDQAVETAALIRRSTS